MEWYEEIGHAQETKEGQNEGSTEDEQDLHMTDMGSDQSMVSVSHNE